MFGMTGRGGAEWDAMHGCGTGGNGTNVNQAPGGAGGRFGGGAGAGTGTGAIGNVGAPGLVVLTYNAKAARRGAMAMIMS
jgi:hypothetical protein